MNRNVAISYSWSTERNGRNKGTVQTFANYLCSRGINVILDNDALKRGEKISDFMRTIGESDRICIFLSDAYLKSPNCMYELYVAFSRSIDNPEDLRNKIRVFHMGGIANISSFSGRVHYVEYWQGKRDELKALVERHGTDGMSDESMKEYNQIKAFTDNVDKVLAIIANTLNPRDAAEFTYWVAEEIGQPALEIEAITGDRLKTFYQRMYDDLNSLLNGNEELRNFLVTHADGLVVSSAAGAVKLPDDIMAQQFDPNDYLYDILDGLKRQDLSDDTMNDLCDLAASVVVMAIDKHWVIHQESLLKVGGDPVLVPSLEVDDPFLPMEADQKANFLSLVRAAISQGKVRLETVFGNIRHPNELAPMASQCEGIGSADKERYLKHHIISCVMGSTTTIPDDDAKLDILFNKAKGLIRRAKRLSDPYSATDPSFRTFCQLISENLEMHDLYLIFPEGGGSEDGLLIDSVNALANLNDIYKQNPNIQSK